MEWYWWALVLVVYGSSGVTSLWLGKNLEDPNLCMEKGTFWIVFYVGPLALLYYGPLYIAKRLRHDIKWPPRKNEDQLHVEDE